MSNIKFEKIECCECGQIDENIEIYNRYEKSEGQLRSGYRCNKCSLDRKKKYQNKKR